MSLYLYLVKADVGLTGEHDVYDSFVVCCKNKREARLTLPIGGKQIPFDEETHESIGWVTMEDIDSLEVTRLGKAGKNMKPGVICASYNETRDA